MRIRPCDPYLGIDHVVGFTRVRSETRRRSGTTCGGRARGHNRGARRIANQLYNPSANRPPPWAVGRPGSIDGAARPPARAGAAQTGRQHEGAARAPADGRDGHGRAGTHGTRTAATPPTPRWRARSGSLRRRPCTRGRSRPSRSRPSRLRLSRRTRPRPHRRRQLPARHDRGRRRRQDRDARPPGEPLSTTRSRAGARARATPRRTRRSPSEVMHTRNLSGTPWLETSAIRAGLRSAPVGRSRRQCQRVGGSSSSSIVCVCVCGCVGRCLCV